MKRLIYLLILIAQIALVSARNQEQKIKYADKQFKHFNFSSALKVYLRAGKNDSANVYVKKQIADCYRLLNNSAGAEKYYGQLASNPQDSADKLYYAEALRANKKYPEALAVYESYLATTNNQDISVQDRILGVLKLEGLQADNNLYTLTNLPINSTGSDFGANYFTNNMITFSSNRHRTEALQRDDSWSGQEFLAIYQASNNGQGGCSNPLLLKGKELNTHFHEGPACYDNKYNQLYITRSAMQHMRDSVLRLKLYKVTCNAQTGKISDTLTEAFSFNSDNYSVMHPTISADGNTLYFASDMKDANAQGGMDLYMCKRGTSGYWQQPVNMGADINTNGDEMFPYIAADSSLYFASNGHAGLGGLDIYRCIILPDGSWSDPQNLGFPVNTNYDDFAYVIDAKNEYGFLSSNRPGGKGDDDIYSFLRQESLIAGQVYDAETQVPLDSAKVILNEGGTEKGRIVTLYKGSFAFSVPSKHTYTLAASKDGYMPYTKQIETDQNNTIVKIYLSKIIPALPTMAIHVKDSASQAPIAFAQGVIKEIETGALTNFTTDSNGNFNFNIKQGKDYQLDIKEKTINDREFYLSATTHATTSITTDTTHVSVALIHNIVNKLVNLDNIYFDLDKATLKAESKIELDKIVKLMNDNANWQIEVAAYTDCRASDDYNLQLSFRRAQSTVVYLESKGIPKFRLLAAGYGESRPVIVCDCSDPKASPCTEEQHAVNRRVEFSIVKQLSVYEK